MGEYALYRGKRIKIGTCEDMYYLRFEDRLNVSEIEGNIDPKNPGCPIRFRLPFPDEDRVKPGEYEVYNRYAKLLPLSSELLHELAEDKGVVQLRHDNGYLVNLPCYHGYRLPVIDRGLCRSFWSGRDPAQIVLSSLKWDGRGTIIPVIRCKYCNMAWSIEWSTILDYIVDKGIRERLIKRYVTEEAA